MSEMQFPSFDLFPRSRKFWNGLKHLVDSFILPAQVNLALTNHKPHPLDEEVEWPIESDGIELPPVTDVWEAYSRQGRAILDHAHKPDGDAA